VSQSTPKTSAPKPARKAEPATIGSASGNASASGKSGIRKIPSLAQSSMRRGCSLNITTSPRMSPIESVASTIPQGRGAAEMLLRYGGPEHGFGAVRGGVHDRELQHDRPEPGAGPELAPAVVANALPTNETVRPRKSKPNSRSASGANVVLMRFLF